MIKNELLKKRSDGTAIIDVVLVVMNGYSRAISTEMDLINNIVIPNIKDKSRVLVAINHCDMVLQGDYWNREGKYPEKRLLAELHDKVEDIRQRIKKSTGVDIEPIYYSAKYQYNTAKLLSFIIKCTPIQKRCFYINNLNKDATNCHNNEPKRKMISVYTPQRQLMTIPRGKDKKVSSLSSENNKREREYNDKREWEYDDRIEELHKQNCDISKKVDDIKNTVDKIETSYQQDIENAIQESLDVVSDKISEGSKTKLRLIVDKIVDKTEKIVNTVKKGFEVVEKIGNVAGSVIKFGMKILLG